jgi:hypothetical protein
VFIAANMAIASAAWTMRIREHRATLQSLTPIFFAVFVVELVIACVPLLLFAPQLYRARHRDTAAYHELAREYVDDFRRKWLSEPRASHVLGTNDIQSLNDLGGSYKTAEDTRVLLFGARAIVNLWAGAVVPMLPLLFLNTPIAEVASHFGKMLFGLSL